ANGMKYPDYWEGHVDKNYAFTDRFFSMLPVIVTYYEAKGYAGWVNKKLPDEKEWEKASRFPLSADKPGQINVFTWGNNIRDGISNTADLWSDPATGENLKKMVMERY